MQVQKIRYCSRGENVTRYIRVKSRPIAVNRLKTPTDEIIIDKVINERKTVLLRKGKQNG